MWSLDNQKQLASTLADYWPREMTMAGGRIREKVFRLWVMKLQPCRPEAVFRILADYRTRSDKLPTLNLVAEECAPEAPTLAVSNEPAITPEDFSKDEAWWKEKIAGDNGEFYAKRWKACKEGKWFV